MYLKLALVCMLGAGVWGAVVDNRVDDDWSGCGGREDALSCLGARAVAAMDRAARMADIQLLPGVTLVKEKDVRSGRALLSPREIEESLPEEPQERSSRLLDLAYDAALRFLQSHSLKLQVPENMPETLERALEEGRSAIRYRLANSLNKV
jgi:hypothetical protein